MKKEFKLALQVVPTIQTYNSLDELLPTLFRYPEGEWAQRFVEELEEKGLAVRRRSGRIYAVAWAEGHYYLYSGNRKRWLKEFEGLNAQGALVLEAEKQPPAIDPPPKRVLRLGKGYNPIYQYDNLPEAILGLKNLFRNPESSQAVIFAWEVETQGQATRRNRRGMFTIAKIGSQYYAHKGYKTHWIPFLRNLHREGTLKDD